MDRPLLSRVRLGRSCGVGLPVVAPSHKRWSHDDMLTVASHVRRRGLQPVKIICRFAFPISPSAYLSVCRCRYDENARVPLSYFPCPYDRQQSKHGTDDMMLSNDGLRFIAGFEGYHEALPDGRCRAYRCVVGKDKKGRPIYDGKVTIGFGCTEGVTEGLIWTREQADTAFREELAVFEAAVNRLVKVPLSQNAFDACVSFAYNCGEGALAKSTLLKKLNKGDNDGAAREFGNWTGSNGVKNVPGLVRRRAEEAAMFLRPDAVKSKAKAPAQEPAMPQTVEAPAPVAIALRSSRTIFGTLLTSIGLMVQGAVDIALKAAEQIEMLAPTVKVASALGINATTISYGIAIAGIALAIYARLDDAHKGATVK